MSDSVPSPEEIKRMLSMWDDSGDSHGRLVISDAILRYARANDPAYQQAREALKCSLHWLECWDMRTADEQAREDIQSIRSALRAMGEGVGNG